MESDEIIEKDRIITCDWNENGGILEYDISYLHPDLGVLLQEHSVSSMTYEDKRIFQSSFLLFGVNSEITADFAYLSREIKEQLWNVVFAIKLKFFSEYRSDIIRLMRKV